MADTEKRGDPRPDSEILDEARERFYRAYQFDRVNHNLATEDLEFRRGETSDQWPPYARQQREQEGRPILTINRIPQFVNQVTGDIRQMKPAIRVAPVDDHGDEETAEQIAGLIRYIENRSDAQAAYFHAADTQVAAGIGHWRILREYAAESTFEQELRIAPVADGIGVKWDPDSIAPTREDAQWCFIPIDVSREAFKAKWPHKAVGEWDTTNAPYFQAWSTNDAVRIAEYYYKLPVERELARMPDGEVLDLSDDESAALVEQAEASGFPVERMTRSGYKVIRALLTYNDLLEPPTIEPGRFIPVVPLLGQEVRIGRTLYRHGIIRYAKDAQRMYNFFRSQQAEVTALQPKAPFLATKRQTEQFADEWETANTENRPVLHYTPDPLAPGAPQRIAPPVSSQGISEGVAMAAEDMKAVIGIYDASLGARSNETSGKAIMARQREGDVGSYVYIDNFVRAVRYTGQILVSMIPHVYDTARTIRIMGEDGRIDRVDINRPAGLDVEGEEPRRLNDVTIGAYDVVVDVGPSYTTKRAEARDGMIELLRATPDAAPLMMDLIAKAQDWPMADEIAKRFRLMLPPAVQQMEQEEEGGGVKQQPPQPPQPSPQEQAAQMQAALEQAKMQIEAQKLDVERQKISVSAMKVEAEMRKAELDAAQSSMAAGAQIGGADAGVARQIAELQGAVGQIIQVLDRLLPMEAAEHGGQEAVPQTDVRIVPDQLPPTEQTGYFTPDTGQ